MKKKSKVVAQRTPRIVASKRRRVRTPRRKPMPVAKRKKRSVAARKFEQFERKMLQLIYKCGRTDFVVDMSNRRQILQVARVNKYSLDTVLKIIEEQVAQNLFDTLYSSMKGAASIMLH